VDTQGDAFFVAFARASDALAAAEEAQRALEGGPMRVRIGLHTGEPLVTEEGYVGMDVHRAARIAAAGHGRQILVSQSTRDLARADGLRDLGEHRLKGPVGAGADLPARRRRLPSAQDAVSDEPSGAGNAVPRTRPRACRREEFERGRERGGALPLNEALEVVRSPMD
jgi:class 3 adenylate cyclase